MNNSIGYRKDRTYNLSKSWQMNLRNPFFLDWEIPENLLAPFRNAVGQYLSAAMHFPITTDENELLKSLNSSNVYLGNITPNGAVVPKLEYVFEYNQVLKLWCNIVSFLTRHNPTLLKKFRLTPNIRIKFAVDPIENIGRGLNTALPHSDAWVEGPWGMNCHVPIFGDTDNNYLQFYKLLDESIFSDNFLDRSASYNDMQWVLTHYEEDHLVPQKGYISLSDYVLIHRTYRKPSAGTRVSMDTTIMVGDHDLIADRQIEYLNSIPKIGQNCFVKCLRSEADDVHNKPSAFSHYTTGTLSVIFI